jgi:cephalosporin-C deacetylase
MTLPTTHPFAFDPTYGMTLEQLQRVKPPEAPEGFDEMWRERYVLALAVDPQPLLTPSRTVHRHWQVFDVTYRSTGDFQIGGWLLLPKRGELTRGLVVGHGYGGRDAPNFDLPLENTAVLFPCFRGLSRSAHPSISPDPSFHVLHNIDKPERYIIGGCVEDLWVAVTVLSLLYPRIAGRIGYSGVSFGGGIGGLAIPFDPRIDRGHLSLPTFGHQALRLTLPSVGSAAAVQHYQAVHGNALPALRLHDAAVAASRIRVPMISSVALFDPAVAPPCQFAIANAMPSQFNENFILDAGHFGYRGSASQASRLNQKLRELFRAT